ncbi:hypothetical protein CLF_113218, partial [Clonorchis sinensis]
LMRYSRYRCIFSCIKLLENSLKTLRQHKTGFAKILSSIRGVDSFVSTEEKNQLCLLCDINSVRVYFGIHHGITPVNVRSREVHRVELYSARVLVGHSSAQSLVAEWDSHWLLIGLFPLLVSPKFRVTDKILAVKPTDKTLGKDNRDFSARPKTPRIQTNESRSWIADRGRSKNTSALENKESRVSPQTSRSDDETPKVTIPEQTVTTMARNVCSLCNKQMRHAKNLKQHKLLVHSDEEARRSILKYECKCRRKRLTEGNTTAIFRTNECESLKYDLFNLHFKMHLAEVFRKTHVAGKKTQICVTE